MNILIVSTRPPLPAIRGDQVLLVNRLKALHARGHRVFLCFLHSSDRDLGPAEKIAPYCAGVFPHRLTYPRQALNLALAGLSSTPLQVLLFKDRRFSALVSAVVSRERIDIVNSLLLRPFLAVENSRCPLVVDLVDSMQLNVRRRMSTAPRWLKPVLALEAFRLGKYERHVCDRADASIVVASADKDVIGAERLFVVPLGVDDKEFYPLPDARTRRRIVFSGNMKYHANKAALEWFLESCWATLHDEFPDAELCLVGNESDTLRSVHGDVPGIRLVGRVPSMGAFLRTADVSIAPMRSGSGMQFKVLEAMACGVPTVVSRLGLGDIGAVHGIHTLVADEKAEFIQALHSILTDDDLRSSLARAGAELVKARYTWSSNTDAFEQIVTMCIAARRSAVVAPAHGDT